MVWGLALAWPAGTVFLGCLALADTYTGLGNRPTPATATTWALLVAFLAWTLAVPVVGVVSGVRRRLPLAVVVHAVAFGVAMAYSGWLVHYLALAH